jgi:PhnB protein
LGEEKKKMQVQPYLFFEGRCDEAAAYYGRVLGAEIVSRLSYRDSPEPHQPGMIPPGSEDKVMHMALRVGETMLLASDGRASGEASFKGFAISLTVADAAEAERVFAGLTDGGQVIVPLGPTFFSTHFAMLADRFGVAWIVYVAP